MKKEITETNQGDIGKKIDEMRTILNEICVTAKDNESIKKRQLVSEELDKLIVDYINNNHK